VFDAQFPPYFGGTVEDTCIGSPSAKSFVAWIDAEGIIAAGPTPKVGGIGLSTAMSFPDDGSVWIAWSANSCYMFGSGYRLGLQRTAAADALGVGATDLSVDLYAPVTRYYSVGDGHLVLGSDASGAACTVEEGLASYRQGRFSPIVVWRRSTSDGGTIARGLSARRWSSRTALGVAPDGTSLIAAVQTAAHGRSRIVAVALDQRGRVKRRIRLPWAYDVAAPIVVAAPFGGPTRFVVRWSERAAPAGQGGEKRSFLAFIE
jgi:hypothetical protein